MGVSNNCDEVQLAQPGKSKIEEQHFMRVKYNDESGFVSGGVFLGELFQGKDNPSVLLLSGSDSFSPSGFMNVVTRGGVFFVGLINLVIFVQ